MTPTLTIRLASESVRRFDADGEELDADETREILGFLGVERSLGLDWQVALGAAGHDWSEEGRALSTAGVAAQIVNASRTTGKVFQASFLWTGVYRRVGIDGELSGRIGSFRLRPRIRLGWGERLPVQAAFPLGGDNGFPGLHLGERRGDREALAGLLITYALKGPFVARLDLAVGRSARGGPLLDSDDWLAGARAGIGAETPLGPVRFEYGATSEDRGAVFVRLGRWF
jgi:hypothetical protein